MHPTSLQEALRWHQSGEFTRAEQAYRSLLGGPDEDPVIYNYLADILNRQGRLKETKELLDSASTQYPHNPGIRITLGQTLLGLNEIASAKALAISLLHQFPTLGESHYLMGNVLLQENEPQKALAAFNKTVEYMPGFVEAHYTIGVLTYQRGDRAQAEDQWKECLRLAPSFTPALLNLGNLELERQHYREALHYFNTLLEFSPEDPLAHKLTGMAKHSLGDREGALEHYLKMQQLQGPGEESLTLLGNAYRDLDRMAEAEDHYEKVLKINPENALARENLGKIRGSRISGWHFDMLSDLARNEGYDQAIRRAISGGETALDIGTGTGLLSMMCVRAGARKVYTCEVVKDIADAAEEVIAANGYKDQVTVFKFRSSNLILGRDIPEKADILVSEVLDSGLLGEGVLPTVRHAKENLLKPGGKIIPQGALVKGMLIQSEHLRAISPLHQLSGFDLSSFGKFQREHTYRTYKLRAIPHTVLSGVVPVLNVDFYNLPPSATFEAPNVHTVKIPVHQKGEVHAIAFWFDLHLDAGLTLSSGPEGEMIHWGQAVFCFPETKTVKAGDSIDLKVLQTEDRLAFEIVHPAGSDQ